MNIRRKFLVPLKQYPLGRSIYQLAKRIYELAYQAQPSTPKDLRQVLSVDGKITPSECGLLYKLASQVSSECIVDIGSYRGRSTAALALGSLAGKAVPVYAIAPHEPFEGVQGGRFGPQDRVAFFRNMLRLNVVEIIRLINLGSDVVPGAWHRPVTFLWIDGDHTYEAVKRDFEMWEQFVVKEGLIGLHDSTDAQSGPGKIVAAALDSKRFKIVDQVDLTTILRKI
jgi:hypothetical protein